MRKVGAILFAVLIAPLVLHSPVASPADTKQGPASKSASKPRSATTKKNDTEPAASASRDRTLDNAARSRLESVSSRTEELRGIWITTDAPRSASDWETVMKKLKTHGLNSVFVRVAQGGRAIYPSSILPQDQWASDSGEDELAKAVEAAHRHGLQFHAWKVCFPMGAAKARPAGSAAAEFYDKIAREDRLVRDSHGNQGYWLNPLDPRNQELELRVAGELVGNYAVDGYHLDYIRFPADKEPSTDFEYGDVSRREFEKWIGKPVADWPADVISGRLKMRYEDWERDALTRLVGRIRTEVKARRDGTLLSAAVWRKVHRYRTVLKQDWPRWCREGLLDFVVPMAYEPDVDNFRSVVERDFSQVCGQVPFVVGIGSYLIDSPEAVVDEVKAARQLGADGFVLFSINDPEVKGKKGVINKGLVDRQLAALAAGATKSPATPGVGRLRVEFAFSPEVIARRYKSFAVQSGQAAQVAVRLPEAYGVAGELQFAACFEDLRGRPVTQPRAVKLRPGGEQSLPLLATDTAIRPVVRGTIGRGGDARPFVVRGPIVEPSSASEIAELRARDLPPRTTGAGTKVGVYFNGLGADAIYETLDEAKGVSPVWIYHLETAHLAKLDVLVLPQFADLSDLTPDVAKTLRNWVEGGGRLILTRDAVGLRWHPRLFAEVGKGSRIVEGQSVQVSAALRGFAKASRFNHECKDHVQLDLGPAGKMLLAEAKTAKPVVAAGRVGKGTVVLNGLLPGSGDEAASGCNSLRLLVALVHYR